MPTILPRRLAYARGTSGLTTCAIPAGFWTAIHSLLLIG